MIIFNANDLENSSDRYTVFFFKEKAYHETTFKL